MTIMTHPRKLLVVDVSWPHWFNMRKTEGFRQHVKMMNALAKLKLVKDSRAMAKQKPFVALAKKLVPGLFSNGVSACSREEILLRWLENGFEGVPVVDVEQNTWVYGKATDLLCWPLRDDMPFAMVTKTIILSFLFGPGDGMPFRVKHIFESPSVFMMVYFHGLERREPLRKTIHSDGTEVVVYTHGQMNRSTGFGKKYGRLIANIHEADFIQQATGKTVAVKVWWSALPRNVSNPNQLFQIAGSTGERVALQAFNNRFGAEEDNVANCPFRVVLPSEVDQKTLVIVDGFTGQNTFALSDLSASAKDRITNMVCFPSPDELTFFMLFQNGTPYDWATCRQKLHQSGLPVAFAERLPDRTKDRLMNLGHKVDVGFQAGYWTLAFLKGKLILQPHTGQYYIGKRNCVSLEPINPNQQPKRRRPGSGGWNRQQILHRAAEEEIAPSFFATMTAKAKAKGFVQAPKWITRRGHPVCGFVRTPRSTDDCVWVWTGRVRRQGRAWVYEATDKGVVVEFKEKDLKLVRNRKNIKPSVGGHVAKVAIFTPLFEVFD